MSTGIYKGGEEKLQRMAAQFWLELTAREEGPIGAAARMALLVVRDNDADPRLLALVIERAIDGEFVVAPGDPRRNGA